MSVVGEGAELSMPTAEDGAHELIRLNARLKQFLHVRKPDPALANATAGLRPAKPGAAMGPLTTLPSYSEAAAAVQRQANADARGVAAEATSAELKSISELTSAHGADLGGMSKEDVLAQLRARRVPESNFLGKGGGARQAATLRKLLLRWDADETAETAPPAPPAAVQAASHDPAPADFCCRARRSQLSCGALSKVAQTGQLATTAASGAGCLRDASMTATTYRRSGRARSTQTRLGTVALTQRRRWRRTRSGTATSRRVTKTTVTSMRRTRNLSQARRRKRGRQSEGPEDEVGGLELRECFVRGQCTG